MDYITLALAKDYADQVAAGGGSSSVDLKDYYKKTEVDNKLTQKVDKIEGKSLSTNDYTTEEKEKLASLENYNDEEIKNSINLKANTEDVYLKTEIDTKLNNKANKATTLAGYGITDSYTKSEIDGKVSSIYKYKGSVTNKEALPIENLTVGDVYNLEDTGMNVAWATETESIANGSKVKTIFFPEKVNFNGSLTGADYIDFKLGDTIFALCTYQDMDVVTPRLINLNCQNQETGDNCFSVTYQETEDNVFVRSNDDVETYTFEEEMTIVKHNDPEVYFMLAYKGKWDELGSTVDLSDYYTKTEVDNLSLIKGLIYDSKYRNLRMASAIIASENSSVALGAGTAAKGYGAFAEGLQTTASAQGAHAEGSSTTASGKYSHAEGYSSKASGLYGHAEGSYCEAAGLSSHAEGNNTTAKGSNQHVQGKYNVADTSNAYAHIVGNGADNSTRSNAHTVDWEGNAWYQGDIYTGSASGTNKDEGSVRLAKITELDAKVDKVEGKDLSSNDFTNDLKTKLEGLSNYNDSELKTSIENKVDKITGKGLSTEDYTTEEKTKLAGLSNYNDTEIKTTLNSKANSSDVYTKTEITTELNKKVDKVEGKGLSTNDFTDDLNTKLAGITAGAEVNTIDTVKLNGETLTITDKAVNIEVPVPEMQACDVVYPASILPVEVVNGDNSFTQSGKTFSANAFPGSTYETTITLNKENISAIVLNASLSQDPDTSNPTKFIETGCVAKIELSYNDQSQTIMETSNIGQTVLIESVANGMQIKLTLQCSENAQNAMFSVNIENYIVSETTNDILSISDSGDMYLQTLLKQKIAELQTQIDWINNDTSKDTKVKIVDSEAAMSVTPQNNIEYRIQAPTGTSALSVDFNDLTTDEETIYQSVIVLQSGRYDSDSCTVTVSDGVTLQGDDVADNTLTTQKLKIYEILFNWNGFTMTGLVKASAYQAPPQ